VLTRTKSNFNDECGIYELKNRLYDLYTINVTNIHLIYTEIGLLLKIKPRKRKISLDLTSRERLFANYVNSFHQRLLQVNKRRESVDVVNCSRI